MRLTPLLTILVVLSACGADSPPSTSPIQRIAADASATAPSPWPEPPAVPDTPLDPDVADALDTLLAAFVDGGLDQDSLLVVAESRDPRLGWLISDLVRFTQGHAAAQTLVDAFTRLTGVDPRGDDRFGTVPWLSVTNLLIAWDLPAPPDYRERKASLFLATEPAWEPFFADVDSAIDWRLISWGGVLIDDRASGDTQPCPRGCIPALDDPMLTSAEEGDWYADDRIVFGVIVDDEAVAFPKHIMEVHEMVNLTIGDRRIGLPYCTLCGSAQAYLTDAVPAGIETPVLRTSGLLSRSNKVMFDLVTESIFNTFTGRALSGPLHDAGIVLEQATVVVTTWGEWKQTHPDTRIVAQDGGVGRTYPDDPLGGRDDAGPIFPIGQADPRLPAQAQVLGVVDPGAGPVAFPVEAAEAELADGGEVRLASIEIVADAGGLRAQLIGGDEVPAQQAFWFAWSQFHPDTSVWSGGALTDPSPPTDETRGGSATCAAIEDLTELEAELDRLRVGETDGAGSISDSLVMLAGVRRDLAAGQEIQSARALREALLESLDQLADHLRAAEGLNDGPELREALATIPYIATDQLELELREAAQAGFRC
ncbi:MAG: DUF3179 domain-containing (seleno)protein [Chloroflexota bacterium]